ncbi:hypothetical protein [Stenotrophomonas maltophilia]|uniref:hypothetical protein n=1 Tax=Stenotrophomonas maltophilia TaxID=40324 RepID=UPI0015F242D9|nr:hypothetical protein [Stenotrophomonas maltophilia]QDY48756.1 hypothetical protein DUW70_09530 [Stenotrophomonas maltophilia]
MSEIKRFDWCREDMQWDIHGSYVLHSDHEAEVARLRAEVEAVRSAYATDMAEMDAALEKYRKDAERYRWLRARSWRVNGAYFFTGPAFNHETNLDAAIDAAMGASA